MTEVSSEQADAAKRIVNTAGASGALIALASRLPPEILAEIRAAHDDETVSMCCNAHCEGQECCIDVLLDDPARYAPAKVAEAEELLRRYRMQRRGLARPAPHPPGGGVDEHVVPPVRVVGPDRHVRLAVVPGGLDLPVEVVLPFDRADGAVGPGADQGGIEAVQAGAGVVLRRSRR
jgi:hypothetical protein